MSHRILVTGAGGFVGRNALAPLRAAGAEVHAVSRRAPCAGDDGIHWHRCDLLDPAARAQLVNAARPATVLHLAWETAHGHFWEAPENEAWVAATADLATRAAGAGMRRFVGTGTCFEYSGDVSSDCDETATPLAPWTAYGRAKRDVFLALADWSRAAGVSFAWGRLFMLYGPGEDPRRLVPDVARRLLSGAPAPISSGRSKRDFMDSRDAGAALAALALSGVEGPVNVATGVGVSVREVAGTLGRLSGRPDLVEVGARPDREEPARLVASTARLSGEVGWRGARPIEEGLGQALDYWRGETNPPGDVKTA